MKKIFLGVALVGLLILMMLFIKDAISIRLIKDLYDFLVIWYQKLPFVFTVSYFFLFVFFMACSIPLYIPMSLLAGALFGFVGGTVIVSFACSVGASLAFLFSRFILREWVHGRFHFTLERVNKNIEKSGALYLFCLRLLPFPPFFMVNLLVGVTQLKLAVFFIISQVGMLPNNMIYVNSGRELSKLQSFEDILTWRILLTMSAVGFIPLASHYLARKLQARIRKLSP